MPTRIVTGLHHSLRGERIIGNIFEMWISLAGIISGIAFFYSPASIDGNALSLVIGHNLAVVETVTYMIGGSLVWIGLIAPRLRWEIVGLYMLGASTAASGLSILSVFGGRGITTATTLLTLSAAAWVRALVVQIDVIGGHDDARS